MLSHKQKAFVFEKKSKYNFVSIEWLSLFGGQPFPYTKHIKHTVVQQN